ncbi:MAG TPA: methionyl-tRNA formyltransferase [Firmicutes bacterium]|nr:methionyl-tRNA formyltransferase [Bacillota bacterium]
MGTPDFAVPILETLIQNTNVVLVVSQPDKKVGRKQILTKTPIHEVADKYDISVFQPEKIKNDYERILEVKPDIIITCAYGQIIPKVLLDLPRLGCINVHASLLPKLRGGAPLHHAIIDGLDKTGVTIMYMDEAMDTGDIISTISYDIKSSDTTEDIHDTLRELGAKLLIDTLPSIVTGTNRRIKQNETEATYGYNITREEEHIDFNKRGILIDRLVRGLYSWPLANTIIGDTEYKIVAGYFIKGKGNPGTISDISKKVLGIGCLDGTYYVTKIKPAGKKIMDIKDFLNGIDIEEFKSRSIK